MKYDLISFSYAKNVKPVVVEWWEYGLDLYRGHVNVHDQAGVGTVFLWSSSDSKNCVVIWNCDRSTKVSEVIVKLGSKNSLWGAQK